MTKPGSVQCTQAGLKIESVPLPKQDLSLLERIGSDKFWESKDVMLASQPLHQISELRENHLSSQKIIASFAYTTGVAS
jgi:hypothetical protein